MEVELLAKERNLFGSQSVKHLRHQGEIPAVLYGKKMKNMHIQVKNENLVKILHTSAGENAIIKLNIEKDSSSGEQKKNKMVNVLIKEIQYDPITMAILHIDFSKVSLTEKIVVKVPVKIKGEPVGVIKNSGILDVALWEFEIECLPTDIPEDIAVEVESLDIGDTLHIRDINFPSGIKILEDEDKTVASVIAPKEEKEPEESEETQTEEPEVIREKDRTSEDKEDDKESE